MKDITKGGCVVWRAFVVKSWRLWSARRSLLGVLVGERHFVTLVGVGGAGSVDWVSGALPVPRARLGLPVAWLTICRR